MVIYKITNIKNGKVYIGLTINTSHQRWLSHLSVARNPNKSKIGIDAAIAKYGKDAFIVEDIDSAKTLDELNEKEKYWITYYNSMNPVIGYNIAEGGGGICGYRHSEVSRYKCGSSFRGKHRIKTHDQVDRWRQTCILNNSLKQSEATKKKRSESLKLAYKEGRHSINGKGVGGRPPMTMQEKEANSKNQLGKKTMHNDDLCLNIVVFPLEFQKMLQNNWEFGPVKYYQNISRKNAKKLKII